MPAAAATWDGLAITRAELLTVDPEQIEISPLEDT